MADNLKLSRHGLEIERDLLCTLEGPEKAEFWPATVREIAPEGLALYATSPFGRGTLLRAHLIHAISGRRLSLPVRVVSAWLEDGNGWAVHARFLDVIDVAEIDGLLHGKAPASVEA